MNSFLLKRLRIIQNIFRNQVFLLRQRLWQRQIALAKERAENAEYEWRIYVSEREAWKRRCRSVMCNFCEQRSTECICDRSAELDIIIAMLRRIAKINPRNGLRGYIHSEDSSNGPVGYRVCGRNSWDNTIRAYEEDR